MVVGVLRRCGQSVPQGQFFDGPSVGEEVLHTIEYVSLSQIIIVNIKLGEFAVAGEQVA